MKTPKPIAGNNTGKERKAKPILANKKDKTIQNKCNDIMGHQGTMTSKILDLYFLTFSLPVNSIIHQFEYKFPIILHYSNNQWFII